MTYLFNIFFLLAMIKTSMIFDFKKDSDITNWRILDDVVMGGKSSGSFGLNDEGHAVFSGKISLDNYGGFSSVRYSFDKTSLGDHSKLVLKIKGDGKRYQLRIKHNRSNYYSYIQYFDTSGEWQKIEIPLHEMYPSFRGRDLDLPRFSHQKIEEISILIGNKKEEEFRLLIDYIALK